MARKYKGANGGITHPPLSAMVTAIGKKFDPDIWRVAVMVVVVVVMVVVMMVVVLV